MAGDPCDVPEMGRWQGLDLDQESGPKMELGQGLEFQENLGCHPTRWFYYGF